MNLVLLLDTENLGFDIESRTLGKKLFNVEIPHPLMLDLKVWILENR